MALLQIGGVLCALGSMTHLAGEFTWRRRLARLGLFLLLTGAVLAALSESIAVEAGLASFFR